MTDLHSGDAANVSANTSANTSALASAVAHPLTLADGREPLEISLVRDLPALPAAVFELLEMLGRDDVDSSALVAKISLDQALTAKTLRLANSSFYGMPRHVASVSDATAVLGLRTVRVVLTAAALHGNFKPPECAGFDFMAFWRHAVGTAVSARLIAAELGADAETAFTAGLLHDIGKLILASSHAERYAEVLAQHAHSDAALREIEAARLGIDHAQVGARVAEHWRFPKPIVDAIADHHAPPVAADALALVRIVHVADLLARALAGRSAAPAPAAAAGADPLAPLDPRSAGHAAWLALGLSCDAWGRIGADAELQTQSICAAMLN